MNAESPLGWVAIDFLCCLLLVVYTLIAPPAKPASIDTLGQYAIEVTWPRDRDDDVDTYVEDPVGNVVFYADSDVGLMHLDHDDLGRKSDVLESKKGTARVWDNRERVILRGVLPGETIVNVHAYWKVGSEPCPVTVTLHRLRGPDEKLLERTIVLREHGEEVTVFRFTVDALGELKGHNRLSKRMVNSAGAAA